MITRIIAAGLIAISALASSGVSAEPRGGDRGRSRGRSRGRGHYRQHENPLGSILGGIFGGWLSQQMRPAPPPERYDDDAERDSR